MEIRKLLNESGILGVISTYQSKLTKFKTFSDLNIPNVEKALKIVRLNESILNKKYEDLTISELWKIELITKIREKVIIVGNLSLSLNNQDIEYMQKLFKKLNRDFHKQIIIIDNDVKVFFNLAKTIMVIRNHEIVYKTNDFYDDNLYKYAKIPKIIEFVKFVNQDKKRINKTTDIHELIKDIYRSVS